MKSRIWLPVAAAMALTGSSVQAQINGGSAAGAVGAGRASVGAASAFPGGGFANGVAPGARLPGFIPASPAQAGMMAGNPSFAVRSSAANGMGALNATANGAFFTAPNNFNGFPQGMQPGFVPVSPAQAGMMASNPSFGVFDNTSGTFVFPNGGTAFAPGFVNGAGAGFVPYNGGVGGVVPLTPNTGALTGNPVAAGAVTRVPGTIPIAGMTAPPIGRNFAARRMNGARMASAARRSGFTPAARSMNGTRRVAAGSAASSGDVARVASVMQNRPIQEGEVVRAGDDDEPVMVRYRQDGRNLTARFAASQVFYLDGMGEIRAATDEARRLLPGDRVLIAPSTRPSGAMSASGRRF